METIKEATNGNYWKTIKSCAGSKNSGVQYVEELINKSFENGVKFAQRWISIEDELPQYYQTVLADNGKYMAIVARVSNGDEEYYSIYGTYTIMSPDPIKWRPIELK